MNEPFGKTEEFFFPSGERTRGPIVACHGNPVGLPSDCFELTDDPEADGWKLTWALWPGTAHAGGEERWQCQECAGAYRRDLAGR